MEVKNHESFKFLSLSKQFIFGKWVGMKKSILFLMEYNIYNLGFSLTLSFIIDRN